MESWRAIGLLPRLDQTVQQRREICMRCPYRLDHGVGGQTMVLLVRVLTDEAKEGPFVKAWCQQCRCYLPLKTRMRWAHCPLGYW